MTHHKEVCTCGTLISQCKCPASDKTTIVVKNGCEECKRLTGGR